MVLELNNQDAVLREAIMRSELETLTAETEAMNLYRDYFDGDQPLVYSTTLFQNTFGDAFEGFRDNWMKVIVNAVNNRMKLLNFHFDDDEGNETAKQVWDVLKLNEFDVQQRDLHEGVLVEGRAFMIVWPDPDLGAIVDWQPGQICRVFYDPDRRTRALWAVKRWTAEGGDLFVTFYTPEAVYKYIDTGGLAGVGKKPSSSSALTEVPSVGWFPNLEKRVVAGEPWPLPNPFNRVPVVEFNNTSYKSELEDAIPQQNALNKTLLDMMVTGEFQAMNQRAIETNSLPPTGGWQAGAGEVWHIRSSFDSDGKHIPTQFHTFEAADPSTYMEPVGMWLQHIALTNSTPVRYFMQSDRGGRGDSPSGDSLLVDDKPLNDKIEDKHERWGGRHLDVARLVAASLEIESPFALTGEAVWQDPRHDFRLSILKEGEAMVGIGLPLRFVAKKIGLTPAEETEVLAMIEEDRVEAEKLAEEAANAANVDSFVDGSSSDSSTTSGNDS